MSSTAQISQKLADVAGKQAGVERAMSDAQQKKASKDAEYASNMEKAGRPSSSDSTRRMYLRSASSAQNASLAEGKKIADLSKKRADLAKEMGKLNHSLAEEMKRDASAQATLATKEKRDRDTAAAKAKRDREAAERKRDDERRSDDRRRQHERLEDEQRRQLEQWERQRRGEQDRPESRWLLISAGAPDNAGITYPSEEALAQFLLDNPIALPPLQHLERVTIHLWSKGQAVDIWPDVSPVFGPLYQGESVSHRPLSPPRST